MWVIARCSSFDSGACWAGQLWLLTIDVLARCLYTTMRIMRLIQFIPAFHWIGRIFPRRIRNVFLSWPMSLVQDPAEWTEEAWNHYIEHCSCGKLRRTVYVWHSHHTEDTNPFAMQNSTRSHRHQETSTNHFIAGTGRDLSRGYSEW